MIAFVVGPTEPATNRGFPGVLNSSAACRANSAARLVQEMRIRRQSIFRQHDRRSAKRVRFDDVRSRLKILPVNIQHHVRPRSHQVLIAPFERSSAKVRRRQVALLQHRPHRAIQHQDSLRQQLPQCLPGFTQIPHSSLRPLRSRALRKISFAR